MLLTKVNTNCNKIIFRKLYIIIYKKKINMINLKTFENFGSNQDPKLVSAIKRICTMYKSECQGSSEHPCEYFGDGSYLKELSKTCSDENISDILNRMADYSRYDDEGSSEAIFDYITDDDCDYIAKFLNLPALDYEGEWTDDEEDNWSQHNSMKHLKNFNESLNDKKIVVIKATPTNISELNPSKMPKVSWVESKFFIKDCLEQLIENKEYKDIISNADYILIGPDQYDCSLIKIDADDFEILSIRKNIDLIKSYFGQLNNVFDDIDILFKYKNKYDVTKLFSEKYPDLYNKLANRYNAVERGGNMVDFDGEYVVYSFWDHDDESGTTKKICKIEDLIS